MGGNIPSKQNINGQFQAGAPIRRTRRIYDRISNNNKDYKFGELTSFYMRYDEDQDDAWQKEIKTYYTQPEYIDAIKEYVMTVLSKVHPTDPNPPVSLTFEWVSGSPSVTMSHTGDAYTITISGLRAPPGG